MYVLLVYKLTTVRTTTLNRVRVNLNIIETDFASPSSMFLLQSSAIMKGPGRGNYDQAALNGQQKAHLQRVKGTRDVVEVLDSLRIEFGMDNVKVLTPLVETRLRSGLKPPRPLSIKIPLLYRMEEESSASMGNREWSPRHSVTGGIGAKSSILTGLSVQFLIHIGYPRIPLEIYVFEDAPMTVSSHLNEDNAENDVRSSVGATEGNLYKLLHVKQPANVLHQLTAYLDSREEFQAIAATGDASCAAAGGGGGYSATAARTIVPPTAGCSDPHTGSAGTSSVSAVLVAKLLEAELKRIFDHSCIDTGTAMSAQVAAVAEVEQEDVPPPPQHPQQLLNLVIDDAIQEQDQIRSIVQMSKEADQQELNDNDNNNYNSNNIASSNNINNGNNIDHQYSTTGIDGGHSGGGGGGNGDAYCFCFVCRICGTVLFEEKDLLGDHPGWQRPSLGSISSDGTSSSSSSSSSNGANASRETTLTSMHGDELAGDSEVSQVHSSANTTTYSGTNTLKCTSYYLEEAPSWLDIQCTTKEEEGNEDAEGGGGDRGTVPVFVVSGGNKVYCPNKPKCGHRIGNWSWVGTKCSCGEWICPAFQFIHSKLDVRRVIR